MDSISELVFHLTFINIVDMQVNYEESKWKRHP